MAWYDRLLGRTTTEEKLNPAQSFIAMEEGMTMRVDGGMSNNNWMMQFLADILNIKVERPTNHETTVMGAAYLAGLRVGFFSSLRDIEDLWKSDRVFVLSMDADERQLMYANWKKTVNNLIGL